METSDIIKQEAKQYQVFLSQWTKYRSPYKEIALNDLVDMLTADGQFDFLSSESTEIVKINKSEIDQKDFLDRIWNLWKEDLHKVLTFPHKIVSYTKWTHGSCGWEISIPWMIQNASNFVQQHDHPITELYQKLSQSIFNKPYKELKLGLYRNP